MPNTQENQKEITAPHLIYAALEFEVEAEDENDAETKGRAILDAILKAHKKNYMRVHEAKVADKLTGYFFKQK